MTTIDRQALLDAGVHHGHLAEKWSPDFRPYLFMKEEGRHIIDVDKTIECLKTAGEEMKNIISTGQKILFIGRKNKLKTL